MARVIFVGPVVFNSEREIILTYKMIGDMIWNALFLMSINLQPRNFFFCLSNPSNANGVFHA